MLSVRPQTPGTRSVADRSRHSGRFGPGRVGVFSSRRRPPAALREQTVRRRARRPRSNQRATSRAAAVSQGREGQQHRPMSYAGRHNPSLRSARRCGLFVSSFLCPSSDPGWDVCWRASAPIMPGRGRSGGEFEAVVLLGPAQPTCSHRRFGIGRNRSVPRSSRCRRGCATVVVRFMHRERTRSGIPRQCRCRPTNPPLDRLPASASRRGRRW